MADKAPQEAVMPLPLTKRMLSMAEAGPLGCAFGLTKDKKDCMLLIEKTGSGKKIAAKLRTEGKDLSLDPGTVRFGRVHFQLPDDPGTIRFTVNRSEAGGTVITLTRLAKKAGYQAIAINVDEALDNEAEEPEPGAAPPAPAPAQVPDGGALAAELAGLARRIPEAASSDAALKGQLLKLATDANAGIKAHKLDDAARLVADLRQALDAAGHAPAAAAPTPAAPDPHALAAELADLIRHIPQAAAADPAIKGQLLKLANDANAHLKSHDLAAAAQSIAELRQALDNAAPAPAAGPAAAGPVGRWRQAMADIEAALAQFRKALLADPAITADPRARFVAAAATEIPNMLPSGGRQVEAAIAKASPGADADAALKALADFRKSLASAAQLAKLEAYAQNNIKSPLPVRATLNAAMDEIETKLRAA